MKRVLILLALAMVMLFGFTQTTLASKPGKATALGVRADEYLAKFKATQNTKYRTKAIGLYRQYLKINPAHPGANTALYQLLLSKTIQSATTKHITELKIIYTRTPLIRGLGLIPPSSAEALARLSRTKISSSISPILQLFRNGLREDPNNIRTRVIMAKLYIEIEKPALALNLMRRVMQLSNKKTENKNHALNAQTLYEVAMEQRCERPNPYFDEALKESKVALAINTDNPELELILADLYSIKEAHSLSVYTSKRLYERQPSSLHKMELADHYWFSGDNEKALKLYKNLYSDRKFRGEAYHQSGRLMFGDGNWKLTKKYLRKYLKLVKRNEFYPTLLLAIAEERLNGKKQMIKRLKQIPKSQANSKWKQTLLKFHLGEISGNDVINNAKNVCEKTEAHYYLGMNYLHQGNKVVAKKEFQKVIDLKFPLFIEYRFAKDALARIKTN